MMPKPAPFAKLFDTPQGQLLVTIEFDDDESTLSIRGASCRGVTPMVQYSWETEAACQAAFDAFDDVEAMRNALALAVTISGIVSDSQGEVQHGS